MRDALKGKNKYYQNAPAGIFRLILLLLAGVKRCEFLESPILEEHRRAPKSNFAAQTDEPGSGRSS